MHTKNWKTRVVYHFTKALYLQKNMDVVKDKGGNLITTEKKEHFQEFLNRPKPEMNAFFN